MSVGVWVYIYLLLFGEGGLDMILRECERRERKEGRQEVKNIAALMGVSECIL